METRRISLSKYAQGFVIRTLVDDSLALGHLVRRHQALRFSQFQHLLLHLVRLIPYLPDASCRLFPAHPLPRHQHHSPHPRLPRPHPRRCHCRPHPGHHHHLPALMPLVGKTRCFPSRCPGLPSLFHYLYFRHSLCSFLRLSLLNKGKESFKFLPASRNHCLTATLPCADPVWAVSCCSSPFSSTDLSVKDPSSEKYSSPSESSDPSLAASLMLAIFLSFFLPPFAFFCRLEMTKPL